MADIKWKRKGTRWTIKKAVSLSPIEIQRMNTEQRAELAQFLHSQFLTRNAQFKRSGTQGYALTKLIDDMKFVSDKFGMDMNPFDTVVRARGKSRILSSTYANRKNPQNALATYIGLMQDFFSAKSSTVKGWREIGEEQDRRLFGERVVGIRAGRRYKNRTDIRYIKEIRYRMSDAERNTFWKVYRELYKSGAWTGITSYDSEDQRTVARHWQSGDFDKKDFDAAYAAMTRLLNTRPDFLPEHKAGDFGDPTQRIEERGDFYDDAFD